MFDRRRLMKIVVFLAVAAVLSGVLPTARPAAAASSLQLSASSAGPGDAVRATGYGFQAGDTAVVTAVFPVRGVQERVSTAGGVAANGSFSTVFGVPTNAVPGVYTVSARDFHGNASSRNLSILPVAEVRAGATSGPVGVSAYRSFDVRGSGFGPRELVAISAAFPLYDGNVIVVNRTARADASGRFGTVTIDVPSGARRGEVALVGTGVSSHRSGRVRLAVGYPAGLSLSSASVRPGTGVTVAGHDFVPSSRVRVAVTVPRTNGLQETLSRDVGTDGSGRFATTLTFPSDARPGTYTIAATDLRGGFQAFARVIVALHPTLAVQPPDALPGQTVSVYGGGFGAAQPVAVSARFPLIGGGSHTVSESLVTQGSGSFVAPLSIPQTAAPGVVTVAARSSNAQSSARLLVRLAPTPTPTPTATPTPTPTSTPPPPKRPKRRFAIQYVSLWYHPVYQGAYDHLVVQGRPRRHLGIWVHIYFPNGSRIDFYETTDGQGLWQRDFQVPLHARTRSSDQAFITVQLWKGRQSRKTFIQFRVLR